jgi:hypothetical protein
MMILLFSNGKSLPIFIDGGVEKEVTILSIHIADHVLHPRLIILSNMCNNQIISYTVFSTT